MKTRRKWASIYFNSPKANFHDILKRYGEEVKAACSKKILAHRIVKGEWGGLEEQARTVQEQYAQACRDLKLR